MRQRRQPKKIVPPAPERLPAIIQSLLFVAEEPQEIGTLAKTLGVPRQGVERAVETLTASVAESGLFIQRMGDRVQLSTAPDAAPYIEHFLEVEYGHLSRASLETLAIVAYRQPVTRTMIESVRGVNSDHAVSTLIARRLIEDVGRAPGPGRPVLFGTSIRFLEYFGLQRPDDLPPLPELVAAEEVRTGAPADTDASGDRSEADGGEAAADDAIPEQYQAEPVAARANTPDEEDAADREPAAEELTEVSH
ncbi:MAG: SMC-Scp complex subunit ScpB [Chloroflexi bacterium]|nr:SMC-Scp complex subunit ScpB [Chloroflexota bacterium]